MLISSQLVQFGLNEKEARVYLAVLALGGGSVKEIAAAASLHRVSSYDILETLKTKGFVSDSKKGARRLVLPAEPEELLEMLRGKERAFVQILPELNAIRAKESGRPRASYFEGDEQILACLTAILKRPAAGQEILIQGPLEYLSVLFGQKLKTVLSAAARNARIKIFQPKQSAVPPELLLTGGVEIKTFADGAPSNHLDLIAGGRLLSISTDKHTALLIEDRGEAENRIYLFNSLWNSL